MALARVEIPVVAVDAAMNVVPGASISIVNRDTGTPPTVYQTPTGGATRSLPLTAGSNGRPPRSWVERAPYTITVEDAEIGTDTLGWDAAPATDGSVEEPWLSPRAVGSFSAGGTGASTFATGAVVTFAELRDVSDWYDPATGVFTPQVAGIYLLGVNLSAAGSLIANVKWQALLEKNATPYRIFPTHVCTPQNEIPASGGTAQVEANGTTDAFRVRVTHDLGAATQLAPSSHNFFHGHLIGRL